jgi:hypothetical protein
MSKCISRVTDETFAQHFADNRHKFYVEFRCNRPCFKDMDVCVKCLGKSEKAKLQTSRTFDHGKVNEPIPDISHIYGGNWYNNGVRKWGQPPSEIIQFAIQYQIEARKDFMAIQQPNDDVSKEDKQSTIKMARTKKVESDENEKKEKVIRRRKPKIIETTELSLEIDENTVNQNNVKEREEKKEEQKEQIKIRRKPKIIEENKEEVEEKKPKRGGRKKKEVSVYSEIVNTPQLIHKEVTLPTHLENSLDEFDVDGYEIEYVKLTLFELNNNIYFRDTTKNKLYKRIKEKTIGEYIGRYDKNTESIITDIPDSDDEN